ncbi:SDR family oxidoreductase [bacterium]|nr:SDR family oxidoreductase [bacterium]MBU1635912.1 SDR family oxidoreductase [bacterium]MBU1872636.1 SDR family oxidoreductase [bacterium]
MKNLNGMISIVTGAGSGLGRAISEYLAKCGATVVVTDINLNSANETFNRIKKNGGSGHVLCIDVCDVKAVEEMISITMEKYGRIDYLFNNAGAASNGEFKDMTLEHWHKMMDVNFWGVIYGSRLVYPIMIKQGNGHIINVASFAGLMPGGLMTSYSASKHAAVGFTLNLRSEAKQYGIRVTALCPGYLETPMHASAINLTDYVIEHDKEYRQKKHHYPTPEDCINHMMRGILKNKSIVVSPRIQIPFWWLYRFFPSLIPWIWAKIIRGIKKQYIKAK